VRTSPLVPVGAALGVVGFLALAVEALRVAFSDASLSGWQAAVLWVGLGLLAVGAVLLLTALLHDDAVADGPRAQGSTSGGEPADG
jgi:hypothetical protein